VGYRSKNMIASMTGFGKGVCEGDIGRVTVEVRSVNGRYGDVNVHMPRSFMALESRIKESVLVSISRGRVDVSVEVQGQQADQGVPVLRKEVLAAYSDGIEDVKRELGSNDSVDLMRLVTLPHLFSFETPSLDLELLWQTLDGALQLATEGCLAMRLIEGKKLTTDFKMRIENLDTLIKRVEALAPKRIDAVKQKMNDKLAQLLTPEKVDENRLMMEIALLAERSDVTEECVRFFSHNEQYINLLDKQEAVGRRLNFLLQEMLREANTIGSKAGDAEIAHIVVDIKEELEKLKEQVQNIE
ncbi:MAG: YicC family protein, partial [Candidatus Latescibacteria bacterium]|nr:YicC family protein [Candidatus Latescibacterota bacterium]